MLNKSKLAMGLGAVVLALVWVDLVPNYYVFLGGAACILAIAALGLTVLVGWAGEVSIAQAGLAGTVVYLAAYAVRTDGWHWPMLLGAVFGVAIAVALSGLIALPTAKLSGMYVMVLTLGLQITLERTVFSRSFLTGGGQVIQVPRPKIFGISLDSDKAFYYFTLIVLVGVIFVLARFRDSRHGRAMTLVKTDRRAAAAMGISPYRYKALAFLIAGAMAGVAGVLFIPLYRSPPTLFQFQAFQSLFYLAIPVVAGFESLISVVGVSFLFTMLPQLLESLGSSSTIKAGVGSGAHGLTFSPYLIGGVGLIVGTLVIGPRGIGGRLIDVARSRRTNRALEEYAVLVDARAATMADENGNGNGNGHGVVDLTRDSPGGTGVSPGMNVVVHHGEGN